MKGAFEKNLVCPSCKNNLVKELSFFTCSSCSEKYNIINGVPDFRERDEYWNNVSREKMRELNKLAREKNDWLFAAKKILPEYSEHFIPFYRADSQFLWPTDKDSVILDAGSMWGGVTIPVAQYHKEVYAVDKTLETLEFLDIRAKQMGFKNIHTVAASLNKLPFPDNFFNLVVLSGVLEWVGLDEEVILEKQWQKMGRGLKLFSNKKYSKNPTQMQMDILKEIHRVLKPNGNLFLAIENRIGYIYLLGWPDEHMNMPFIGVLPRFLSNIITNIFLKSGYRTYVYSLLGYKKLLKKAGFLNPVFYGVFNHYINAKEIIPISLISLLKKKIFEGKVWQLRLISKLIPAFLLPYIAPSIMAFAPKDEDVVYETRIKSLLREAGVIKGKCPDFQAVKWSGRMTNDLPVNHLVYADSGKKPSYFCKIARDKNSIKAISTEANNIKKIGHLLKDSNLKNSVPKLIYYGELDGVTLLVTTYVEGDIVKSSLWGYFKNVKNVPFLSKYATKKWLKEIDPIMKKALDFINDFQGITLAGKISLPEDIKQKIGLTSSERVPLSMEHGDYDLCNFIVRQNYFGVVDFEHLAEKKLPFLDLGNLLFNYLIFQWKELKPPLSLKEFAKEYGWESKLKNWVDYYSKISGVSLEILKCLPVLSVLEQNSRNYPQSRNPYSYPMYGSDMIKEMIQWKL